MALEIPSGDENSEPFRGVEPRWFTPALVTLFGAAAIALMLTGRFLFGLVMAAAIVVSLVLAFAFRARIRAFDRRRADANETSYGSLALFGVGWMALGVWRLTTPGSDLILGAVCVRVRPADSAGVCAEVLRKALARPNPVAPPQTPRRVVSPWRHPDPVANRRCPCAA